MSGNMSALLYEEALRANHGAAIVVFRTTLGVAEPTQKGRPGTIGVVLGHTYIDSELARSYDVKILRESVLPTRLHLSSFSCIVCQNDICSVHSRARPSVDPTTRRIVPTAIPVPLRI